MQAVLLQRPSEEETDDWSCFEVIKSLNGIFSDGKRSFVAYDE